MLRAYARYLRQTGSAFSQAYIENAALANPKIASLLVQLFHARFDPDLVADRAVRADELRTQITRALDDVASLDQDRILRSFLDLIRATLRTNHFQPGRPALAHQARAGAHPGAARAAAEVRDLGLLPRVEGVHLRFGKVARGGLRWSDRREDFRTEVLGLVKAQAVKNAVIVPVGAKGGFFAKQLPDPALDRDAWLAEGIGAYKVFIGSLLDLTDNLVGSRRRPPGARGAPRRRRPLPGGRRRQGHGHVLRHRQRGRRRVRVLARGCLRLRRVGGLRPQGDGHHRPGRLGVGPGALPGGRARHRPDDLHGRRRRRHERGRVRQRDAAVAEPAAGGGLRPPPHLPGPGPGPRGVLRRAASGCSRCRAPRGRTTTPR